MKKIKDYLAPLQSRLKNLKSGEESQADFHLQAFLRAGNLGDSLKIQKIREGVLFVAAENHHQITDFRFQEKSILEYLNKKTNSCYKKMIFIKNRRD